MSEANQAANLIQEYFINIFKHKYLLYQGRARRKEFWLFNLFCFICSLILNVIPFLGLLFSLGVILPSVCLGIRRLHDIGKSGWLILVFYGVLFMGVCIIGLSIGAESMLIAIVGTVILLADIVIMLVFLCQDSQPGENKYGPNPKGT